jgi:hypothetical protein
MSTMCARGAAGLVRTPVSCRTDDLLAHVPVDHRRPYVGTKIGMTSGIPSRKVWKASITAHVGRRTRTAITVCSPRPIAARFASA